MASPTSPSSLLHLRALRPHDLPAHPLLSPYQTATSPDLSTFMTSILSDATTFMDTTLPSTFRPGAVKSSLPSAARVQLLSREISAGEGKAEAWFARRSTHTPQPSSGNASFAEFEAGLLDEHSLHESEYTPGVFDAWKVLDWGAEIAALSRAGGEGEVGRVGEYKAVVMSVHEMCHHIPFPLLNRVFPVLILSARTPSTGPLNATSSSFIIVQIPVALPSSLASALYSSGRHRQEGDETRKRKRVVRGEYVSIERVKMVGSQIGDGVDGDMDKVVWEMATASDAKGWLPVALQKLGVPGAVVKDVGFFLKWTAEERRRKTGR
ncbi:hypothetical protein B0A49_02088 [Cryomyces minteri]|uniref:DUF3074 domain-containing protein n=1 Tax=Cryomyces minteri TaxID=331657 RepID=A0A4U0XR05_9PEZI|nr:hypothetical protein B0A49_02088 [Cryomyces minteri]